MTLQPLLLFGLLLALAGGGGLAFSALERTRRTRQRPISSAFLSGGLTLLGLSIYGPLMALAGVFPLAPSALFVWEGIALAATLCVGIGSAIVWSRAARQVSGPPATEQLSDRPAEDLRCATSNWPLAV